MVKVNQPILSFNHGIISPLGLSRVDVEKVALSAEIQTNWFPRLLGSMMLRPGNQYISSTYQNKKSIEIPFIFARNDAALIELTDFLMRVRVDDVLITRAAVSTTITNGNFSGSLTGWTDEDQAGATSSWASGDFAQFVGTGINYAKISQAVTVSAPDQGIQHAVRIVVERGPITFSIVSASDPNTFFFEEVILGTGEHSLAFTPTNNFIVYLSSNLERIVLVKSVNIEAAGIMTLPTPWSESNLQYIRWDESLDVVYFACRGLQQQKIERRGPESWSIVLYTPEDGPVKVKNTGTITLTASVISGNGTLTANQAFFKSNCVGQLYKLVSVGQNVARSISAQNIFSDYIIVRGIGVTRNFSYQITGTFVGTITLERSFDEGANWEDSGISSTIPVAPTIFNDGLDNQVVRYRIGIKTGDYTSGTADVSLSYSLGSITGYVRITSYTSSLIVNIEILKALGSTNPTSEWSAGEWSDDNGWPSSVSLCEGRLFFFGRGKVIGSISDAYESFNDEILGDSGLISRTLGSGQINDTNWSLSLARLFVGTDGAEKEVKTSSFEEPITPTNFRVTDISTQGSINIPAAKLDKKGLFVQSSGIKLFSIEYANENFDYSSIDLTTLCPEIGLPNIVRIAVQRQPETMIHCVRGDGGVSILIYDLNEQLRGWFKYETDGLVEDVVVLPGDLEDKVYYTIARQVDGQTVRYLEKYALQKECQGGTLNKQADSFIIYEGAATNVITGLDHLEGREVVVWGDGIDLSPDNDSGVQKTYTVTSGEITLDADVTVENAIVGLPYSAYYKSSKLAYASPSPLNQIKRISNIGIIAHNIHSQGLLMGRSFAKMDNLPKRFNGEPIKIPRVFEDYDQIMFNFDGQSDTDARLYLKAIAPRPVTLLSAVIGIQTNDKR